MTSSLYQKVYNLFNQWLSTEAEDEIAFQNWLNNQFTTENGKMYIQETAITSLFNTSDITLLYLDDDVNPFNHNAPHTITYENGYSRIHITNGDNGSRYYATIPFNISSNQIYISLNFYTTGMSNDDFGIRIADKIAKDNGLYYTYGAWIITGQGRLAYGYGGLESNNVKYGDYLGTVRNDIEYNYTMKISDTTVYYCLKKINDNSTISEKTYNRTDSYNFSGEFYLYIGGGKFSTGSNDKSIYLKNLVIKEIEE